MIPGSIKKIRGRRQTGPPRILSLVPRRWIYNCGPSRSAFRYGWKVPYQK